MNSLKKTLLTAVRLVYDNRVKWNREHDQFVFQDVQDNGIRFRAVINYTIPSVHGTTVFIYLNDDLVSNKLFEVKDKVFRTSAEVRQALRYIRQLFNTRNKNNDYSLRI